MASQIVGRLVVFALVALLAAPAWSFDRRLELHLEQALPPHTGDDARTLHLNLSAEGAGWQEAWAHAPTYNRGMHVGAVTAAEVAGDRLTLTVELEVEGDPWVPGGEAAYQIEMTRDGDRVTGSFTGEMTREGQPLAVQGPVVGYVLPVREPLEGWEPLDRDARPRMLLRPYELPELRERLATPFGQAIRQRLKDSTDPVVLGVLYQLTEDADYAERAFEQTARVMADRDGGPFAQGRFWGYRTKMVGFAYDLCHDAWSDEQRRAVATYLDWVVSRSLYRQHTMGTVNMAPGSNYVAVIYGGAGIAAEAMRGTRLTYLEPAEPEEPSFKPRRLSAPADYEPGEGVPVVALPLEQTPRQWLKLGPMPLHHQSGEDPLASAGGPSEHLPHRGLGVTFRDRMYLWEPISREANPDLFADAGWGVPAGQVVLDKPALTSGRENTRVYLFNAVRNEEAGWYRFNANFWSGACYLAGERLGDGEVVHLEAGVYPFLVPIIVGEPTGRAFPKFEPADAEAAETAVAGLREQWQDIHARWEREHARWRELDGVDPAWDRRARKAERLNYLNVQHGIGDGGFHSEGEGYTQETYHVLHDYAIAYQQIYGRSLTGRPDISHFIPRYIFTTTWHTGRDGALQPRAQSFANGPDVPRTHYMPRALKLAPEAWRPVVLWYWLRCAGVTHEQIVAGDGEAIDRLIERRHPDREIDARLLALLSYPLDLAPQHPEDILPRYWEAPGQGFYGFRNSWEDERAIVAQIVGKTGPPVGWSNPNAGHFQIAGLGRAIARSAMHDRAGNRWYDNVVVLPEDPFHAGGRGRLIHAQGDAQTGSGVVSFDLSALYQLHRETDDGPERYDAGIRGLRSFAADYSGQAGVPGLFAIVDTIDGGRTKQWLYQLPADDHELDLRDDGFTLTFDDDVSLHATFVGPANVTLRHSDGETLTGHELSDLKSGRPNAIIAETDDEHAGYFVVMTLSAGEHPAVQVEGQDLDATVTVGERRLTFDGEKLVME
ncbi:MAG: hypothetical protein WD534_17310 [Phycisphaeraceae bacterium]